MSGYLAQVGSIAGQLADEIAKDILTTLQLNEWCVPLEGDLSDWIVKYEMWDKAVWYFVDKGLLRFDEPLTEDLAEQFVTLRDKIPGFQTRLDEILGLPFEEPEVYDPGYVPPPRDDLEELKSEVDRMIRIVSGEEPDPVTDLRIPTLMDPWFGVIDAIRLKEYGTTAEQASLGAETGMLAAITTMFSATTFAAFMLEEGCQALGMSVWIGYNAKEYSTAWTSNSLQDELIREAKDAIETWRPLMPLTYPGFKRFFDAAGSANGAWFVILAGAMEKAGMTPSPTLAVASKPSGAKIYIDGADTDTLTPETFRTLTPGEHTITAVAAATKTIPERGGSRVVSLVAGKKLEIALVLLTLEEGAPPEVLPTAPATLRILSRPSDAQIWIDGADTGVLTPETFRDVPPGEYTIRVVVPPVGYTPELSAEITITLTPGDKRELLLSPTVQ